MLYHTLVESGDSALEPLVITQAGGAKLVQFQLSRKVSEFMTNIIFSEHKMITILVIF